MTAVIGLGNPGSQYAATRHNVGFRVVDILAERHGRSAITSSGAMTIVQAKVDRDVLLVKPLTYMNRSGEAVAELLSHHDVGGGDDLIVIHDDMDLDLGDVRLKRGGGHGGHNGIRSVMEVAAAAEFLRTRLGIGRDPAKGAFHDWVLDEFGAEDEAAVGEMLHRGADAVESVLRLGVARAMTEVNRRDRRPGETPTDLAATEQPGSVKQENL